VGFGFHQDNSNVSKSFDIREKIFFNNFTLVLSSNSELNASISSDGLLERVFMFSLNQVL